MYFLISRHATILSKGNKVDPLPTLCAMLFWPNSSHVHSCVTANSIAIGEGGGGNGLLICDGKHFCQDEGKK